MLKIFTAKMSLSSNYFVIENNDDGLRTIFTRSPNLGIRNFFSPMFELYLGMYFESGILRNYHKQRVINENVMMIRFIRHRKIDNVYSYFGFLKTFLLE